KTYHGESVELGHDPVIGILLRCGDGWHLGGGPSRIGDGRERCVGLDREPVGFDAGDFLPEIVGGDVEDIKVFVTLEFDGERLFYVSLQDRIMSWTGQEECRPAAM